eukprot:4637741-Pyramimonas_sp.AAC.1
MLLACFTFSRVPRLHSASTLDRYFPPDYSRTILRMQDTGILPLPRRPFGSLAWLQSRRDITLSSTRL